MRLAEEKCDSSVQKFLCRGVSVSEEKSGLFNFRIYPAKHSGALKV